MKLCALILISSLAQVGAAKIDETLATINGEAIYLSDFQTNWRNVLDEVEKNAREPLPPDKKLDLRRKVMDQMVDDLLLLQEAKKQGVKVYKKDVDKGVDEVKGRFRVDERGVPVDEKQADEGFQAEIRRQQLTYRDFEERIRRQLMVIKLVDEKIKADVKPPADKEVNEFFDKVKTVAEQKAAAKQAGAAGKNSAVGVEDEDIGKLAELLADRIAERVRARHILIKAAANAGMAEKSKALKTAQKIKEDIKAGADFGELARRYSEDPASAKNGGDLGYFIRGWMVPAFEKAAFSLPVGELSDPVETEFGYHLIMVEEKRAKTGLRLEEIRDDLAQFIMQRKFQKKLKIYVEGLRKEATIKIQKDVDKL